MVKCDETNVPNLPTKGLNLPLVSVIVVNYNYGRYLSEAVESVFSQTYPNIECIIVDNASTDESQSVIADLIKKFPALNCLRRTNNGGQSIASKDGFEASNGEYIVLLDADDFLLPRFVETHIFVHLSLRIPVGLTSVDMVQMTESRATVSTCFCVSEYVRSGKGKKSDLLRRVDKRIPALWPLPGPDPEFESRLHFVPPCDATWVWPPTSGNCLRRDALQLFLNNEDLAQLRGCTDAYLLRGVSLLTGSVLIDDALAVYRIHKDNLFSKHPDLYCLIGFERGSPSDSLRLAKKLLIDHLIRNAKMWIAKSQSPHHFINALSALDEAWPSLDSAIAGYPTYLGGKIVSQSAIFIPQIGAANFSAWLARLKVEQNVPIESRAAQDESDVSHSLGISQRRAGVLTKTFESWFRRAKMNRP